ncbi:DUF1302 family protein [Vibrio sp. RC27]
MALNYPKPAQLEQYQGLRVRFLTVLMGLSLYSVSAIADEFSDLFAEDPFADIEIETIQSETGPLQIELAAGVKTIINTNSNEDTAVDEAYSGLSSLAISLNPDITYQPNDEFRIDADIELSTDLIFELRSDETWSDDDVDAREFDSDINELKASYQLGNWQISTGIQRITLGIADALSASNVLYAQNLEVPGIVDVGDSYAPAWTTALKGNVGDILIKAGIVHTHELLRYPVTGSDFDIGIQSTLEASGFELEAEAFSLENMGWFSSFSGVKGALDWQLNLITQLSHTPVLKLQNGSIVDVQYPRTHTIALATSYVIDAFLLKAEGAFENGMEAQSNNGEMSRYDRVIGSLGFDYDPSSIGRLVVEFQAATIIDFDSYDFMETDFAPDEATARWALIYTQSFLHEQLSLSAQMLAYDADMAGGRIQSIKLEYDISDNWKTTLRYVDYVSGDYSLLSGVSDRDRLILSTRYAF